MGVEGRETDGRDDEAALPSGADVGADLPPGPTSPTSNIVAAVAPNYHATEIKAAVA